MRCSSPRATDVTLVPLDTGGFGTGTLANEVALAYTTRAAGNGGTRWGVGVVTGGWARALAFHELGVGAALLLLSSIYKTERNLIFSV